MESPIKDRKIRNEFSLAKIIFAITEIVINKTGDKAIQKLVRTGGNFVSAATFEVPKSSGTPVFIPFNKLPKNGPAIITVGIAIIKPYIKV